MTSRHGHLSLASLAVVGCLLLALTGFAQAATVNVVLITNPDGTCSQVGSSNPVPAAPAPAPVLVDHGNTVKYVGAKDINGHSASFDVKFNAPFGDLGSINAGHTVTTPIFQGDPGEIVNYRSLTIANQPCLNGGTLGIIMR